LKPAPPLRSTSIRTTYQPTATRSTEIPKPTSGDSLWQPLDLVFSPCDVHQRYTWDFSQPPPQISITLLFKRINQLRSHFEARRHKSRVEPGIDARSTYGGDDVTFVHGHSVDETVVRIRSLICKCPRTTITRSRQSHP